MPFRIVRNDITKMNTEAIVNTANENPAVGPGCDTAVYKAAGYQKLLEYRREKIGHVQEGEAFVTPGFDLPAKYIIHAVSPLFRGGDKEEEKKLRSCYRNSLRLAKEYGVRSIAFPLIATGSFGYPREEGMRIAIDEFNAFLLKNEMDIFLVVFSDASTGLGMKLFPSLESYIDSNYVEAAIAEEYPAPEVCARGRMSAPSGRVSAASGRASAPSGRVSAASGRGSAESGRVSAASGRVSAASGRASAASGRVSAASGRESAASGPEDNSERGMSEFIIANGLFGNLMSVHSAQSIETGVEEKLSFEEDGAAPCERPDVIFDYDRDEKGIAERMKHLSDTFSEYLMFLIKLKKLDNAEVWKAAIVDRKVFSKIKNDVNYHPTKLTALCLCMGARLNLDEAKDLLARAGYALSPCDKTDVIFSYFIENEIYDMIELDIQLEEHGLPCIVA